MRDGLVPYVVIGNLQRHVHVTYPVENLIVFNSVPHLSMLYITPPPKNILQVHNALAPKRVHAAHVALQARFPSASVSLVRPEPRFPRVPIRNTTLPRRVQECFTSKKHDGHPWSIGFFVAASLIQRGVAPIVYNFNHFNGQGWSGHPMLCEQMAMESWSAQHAFDDRRSGCGATEVACRLHNWASVAVGRVQSAALSHLYANAPALQAIEAPQQAVGRPSKSGGARQRRGGGGFKMRTCVCRRGWHCPCAGAR
jgi:hypothetical protein